MSADPDCIFCKIVAGGIPCFKLYEDDDTLAFMDINPANEGHSLAIIKAHYQDIHKVPEELIAACVKTAKRVAAGIEKALSPDGLNLIQANGPGALQSVPHFHIHILPRRMGDELKLNWGHIPGDVDAVKAAYEKVKAAI
ncbi:MAG: HIT family protein [Alphaproteobacteria bacterium]|nr:HIT family protein [Alphaproteobacteria bacterium]